MKIIAVLFLLLPSVVLAQGGIGNKPRTDIVMLSQAARDSLSDAVLQNIADLKRLAERIPAGKAGDDYAVILADSAAPMIAWEDSTKMFTRAANPANPEERAFVAKILLKLSALFRDYSDSHPMYYAVFKTKETPLGQKHLYQIKYTNGTRSKMISWVFYPIGDKLLLGSF